EMICHHDMDRVIGSPACHVAAHAVCARFMHRRLCERWMAPGTYLVVMRRGFFSTTNVVRIMATGAAKFSGALQKAKRFPKPVARLRDFEASVFTRRAIEGHLEVRQRLSRYVGERSAIEADDRMRQFLIRCFQM